MPYGQFGTSPQNLCHFLQLFKNSLWCPWSRGRSLASQSKGPEFDSKEWVSTLGFSLAHTFVWNTGVVPMKQNRGRLV